jgi:hypothetical protein
MVTEGKISGKTHQKIRAQNPTQSINPTHTISVVDLPSIVSVQTGDRTAAATCTATKLNGLAHCHNPFLETFGKRKEGDSNESKRRSNRLRKFPEAKLREKKKPAPENMLTGFIQQNKLEKKIQQIFTTSYFLQGA